MPSSAGVEAATNQLGNIQGLMNLFLQLAQGNTNVAQAAFQQFLSGQGPFAGNQFGQGGSENLLNQTQAFRDKLTNPMNGFQLPPQMQALYDQLQPGMNIANFNIGAGGQTGDTQAIRDLLTKISNGATGPQANVADYANRVLGNWGMTGSMGSGLEASQALMANGGMNAALENMSNLGGGILNQRGYGPETQGAMDFFSQIMQNGGRDAGTQGLVDQGKSLMANGGMTSQMSGLLGQLQAGMSNGGMTPQSQQLFDKVMGIVNNNGQGGALLPMQSVLSMAKDAAGTASMQQAEAARRSAMQRQGSAVGAGTTEDLMNQFGDKSSQAQAEALRGAASSQQELQLKQLLGAMGIGGDLTKSAQTLLGQYAGDSTDLMKTAAGNMSTGAGLMGQGEQLAATRMGQGVSGFQDTINNTLTRLGLGTNMVTNAQTGADRRSGLGIQGTNDINNAAFKNQLDASGLLNKLTDQSVAAGNGLNLLSATEFGHENDAYKNLMGLVGQQNGIFTGQQGAQLQGNAQYIDAFLKSLGISSDMSNSFTNQWMQAGSGLTNIGQLFSSLVPSAMGAYGSTGNSLIQAQMQPGFWGQFAQTLLGAGVGAGSAALGGLFGKTSGSKGGGGLGSMPAYGGG